ncbi:hypothetical protein [Actinoplanes derwentensis]|uniref:Uncharacterized protein n=1 Tax=Actinoplanes derwentensis TaxID=113562 RepID=A0A1H1VUP0_9ACTN|nr:hypothetical protein [Actinoplanes derwentensis]SDS88395.1 hypothetical protein SAMN04489716_1882 [Actinoplanes derwentensis]
MATADKTRVPLTGIVVLVAGLAVMAALSWQAAGHLPDPVTLAGAGKDGTDQHASKALVLSGFPLLTAAIGVLSLAVQRLPGAAFLTLGRDDRTHRKAVDLALGVVTPVLLSIHLLLLRAADGQIGSALGYVAAAVALVVIVVGNAWPKQAPAVPEALDGKICDPVRRGLDTALEAQRRKLRPTGITMLLLGLVAIVVAWPAPMVSLAVSMAAVLVMAMVPLVTVWWSVMRPGSR